MANTNSNDGADTLLSNEEEQKGDLGRDVNEKGTIKPPPASVSDNVLTLYLSRIGQVNLLTPEEEVTLAKQIEAGKGARRELEERTDLTPEEEQELLDRIRAGEEARDHFIEANTRLVVSVAKRYRNYGLPFQDLIQAGNVGLIRAVDRFDYEMGNRFSTYAMWWIRQSIERTLTQQGHTIRLPYYLRNRIRRIRRRANKLEKRLGRRPTVDELAEELGEESAEQLGRLLQISGRTVSLNMPVGDGESTELLNMIEDVDTPSPAETVQDQLMREELQAVMEEALSDREILILCKRFGLR
ncbi:MAG: sigma-70 family RNA polymerase sigma factor [Anaerolineae bacterium]